MICNELKISIFFPQQRSADCGKLWQGKQNMQQQQKKYSNDHKFLGRLECLRSLSMGLLRQNFNIDLCGTKQVFNLFSAARAAPIYRERKINNKAPNKARHLFRDYQSSLLLAFLLLLLLHFVIIFIYKTYGAVQRKKGYFFFFLKSAGYTRYFSFNFLAFFVGVINEKKKTRCNNTQSALYATLYTATGLHYYHILLLLIISIRHA